MTLLTVEEKEFHFKKYPNSEIIKILKEELQQMDTLGEKSISFTSVHHKELLQKESDNLIYQVVRWIINHKDELSLAHYHVSEMPLNGLFRTVVISLN